MRVFGSLAIACNPSRETDNFETKRDVFLGYLQHQIGYKLLNLLTHTRFVSRDVVLYEHIFPYEKISVSQVLKPVPALVSSPLWYEEFVSST